MLIQVTHVRGLSKLLFWMNACRFSMHIERHAWKTLWLGRMRDDESEKCPWSGVIDIDAYILGLASQESRRVRGTTVPILALADH